MAEWLTVEVFDAEGFPASRWQDAHGNALNDVTVELQIAAREQRLAEAEAERVARAQAARRAALLASATPAKAAGAAPEPPAATPAPARKEPRSQ